MDPENALRDLQQNPSLSILDISQPFLHPDQPDESKRASNASDASAPAAANTSLLAADLAHYRDLFSKLRFSYVEQVTKENFLKAITANEPEFVDAGENAMLEEKLRGDKAALKERKEEVGNLIRELEEQGRSLASRKLHLSSHPVNSTNELCNELTIMGASGHGNVQLRTTQLATLPSEISNLERILHDLRAAAQPKSSNPSLALPLQPTLELLQQREAEARDLDAQIEQLRAALPAKTHEMERLRDELTPLQARKIKMVQEAQEARKRREDGGASRDELEERGRWLRGQEAGLRAMLEV